MGSSQRRLGVACAVLALPLLASCGDVSVITATQVTLVVYADEEVRAAAEEVTLRFRTGPSQSDLTDSGEVLRYQPVQWPVSAALLRESDARVFEVTTEAFDGDGKVVSRWIVLSAFAEGQSKLLEITLQPLPMLCASSDCEAGENCLADDGDAVRCQAPIFADPDELPNLVTDPPDAGTMGPDGGGAATCGGGEVLVGDVCAVICDADVALACEHGSCIVAEGEPTCACDDGYSGELCERCASGFVLESGSCVGLCTAANAPDCGPVGECSIEGEVAVCACEFPRGGNMCAECAEGYVLQDDVCEPDCGTCPSHSFCDVTPTIPDCACAVGYADLTDNTTVDCTWQGRGNNSGGIVDGDFNSDAGWTSTGAQFNADIFGDGDGGATFNTFSICEDAHLSQTIQMPSQAQSGIFVLELTAASQGTSCNLGVLARLGDSLQGVPFNAATETVRLCLGQAIYGSDVEFSLLPDVNATACEFGSTQCTSRMFRDVAIKEANPNECPEPGTIPDPNFDSGVGWSLSGNGITAIARGELRLSMDASLSDITSQSVLAKAQVSLPSAASVPNTALEVRYRNTGNEPAVVSLANVDWFGLGGDAQGTTRTVRHCIPNEFLGSVRELEIAASGKRFQFGQSLDVRVEMLSFVSDETCADSPDGVRDSSMELPLWTGPWWSIGGQQPAGVFEQAPANAHTGNGAFHHKTVNVAYANSTGLRQLVRVPTPAAGNALVVSYWVRGNQDGNYDSDLLVFGAIESGSLAAVSGIIPTSFWTEHTTGCLPKRAHDTLATILVQFGRNGAGNGSGNGWADDVAFEEIPEVNCP